MSATKHPGAAASCKRAISQAYFALLILTAALWSCSVPPVPIPRPTTGPCCLVFEEEGRPISVLSQILDDPSVSVRMKQLGARWLFVTPEDCDETGGFPEWLEEYRDTALAAGLPYLFITDELGNVAWSGKMPDSQAAFLEVLQRPVRTDSFEVIAPGRSPGQLQLIDPAKKRPLEAAADKSGLFPTQAPAK